MTTVTIDTPPPDHYRFVTADVGRNVDPTSQVDVVCFMTTSVVDADNEIVLPSGGDFSRFKANPVLLLCHGYGQPGSHHPLPIGRVAWTKTNPNGVLAGVKFAQSSAMGREVKGLFEEGMFRSFSIGFRSLESSPLTREEANSRPDWRAAFEQTRGKILVHRKWLLLELSAVPLPANPEALVAGYQAKGLPIPSWLQLEKRPMDDATDATEALGGATEDATADATEAVETKAVCSCGKGDCPKCGVQTKDADEEEPDEDDTDDNGEAAEGAGYKRGDHVRVGSPHYKGVGEVQGVYHKGHVPHVPQDVMGTADKPAARVKCYKAMGDGHVPTSDHVGVHCKHLSKMAEPMRGPSKKSLAPSIATKAAPRSADDGRLPPLDVLSDEDLQRQALEQLGQIPRIVDESVARYMGVV